MCPASHLAAGKTYKFSVYKQHLTPIFFSLLTDKSNHAEKTAQIGQNNTETCMH